MFDARITLFAGHYGSGKTNLAVNYAMHLKKHHPHVAIADLDIVNPYFRTKDSEATFEQLGIRFISSEFANTNVELPAMPSNAVALFDDKALYGVIDVGGDDRGAYAVGRYADHLADEPSKNILLVVNSYRPLTRTADALLEIQKEIEAAAHIQFTGIVNNSNLGAQTTLQDIVASSEHMKEVAEKLALPLMMTAVKEEFLESLRDQIPNLFGLKIITKNEWRI